MLTRLLGLSSLVLFIGCSTFSKQQCMEMNWATQGRTAALNGLTAGDRLRYFDRECFQEHGVSPDARFFQAGYEEGLKEFCTPQYSFQFATRGGEYNGICPAEKEKAVVESMHKGRYIYLEREVSYLSGRVTSLESQVSSLQSDLSSCQSRANSCESDHNSCQR